MPWMNTNEAWNAWVRGPGKDFYFKMFLRNVRKAERAAKKRTKGTP